MKQNGSQIAQLNIYYNTPPRQLQKSYCNIYLPSRIPVHIYAKYQQSTVIRVRKYGIIIHSNITVQVHSLFTWLYHDTKVCTRSWKYTRWIYKWTKIKRMLTYCNWDSREQTGLEEGLEIYWRATCSFRYAWLATVGFSSILALVSGHTDSGLSGCNLAST